MIDTDHYVKQLLSTMRLTAWEPSLILSSKQLPGFFLWKKKHNVWISRFRLPSINQNRAVENQTIKRNWLRTHIRYWQVAIHFYPLFRKMYRVKVIWTHSAKSHSQFWVSRLSIISGLAGSQSLRISQSLAMAEFFHEKFRSCLCGEGCLKLTLRSVI